MRKRTVLISLGAVSAAGLLAVPGFMNEVRMNRGLPDASWDEAYTHGEQCAARTIEQRVNIIPDLKADLESDGLPFSAANTLLDEPYDFDIRICKESFRGLPPALSYSIDYNDDGAIDSHEEGVETFFLRAVDRNFYNAHNPLKWVGAAINSYGAIPYYVYAAGNAMVEDARVEAGMRDGVVTLGRDALASLPAELRANDAAPR